MSMCAASHSFSSLGHAYTDFRIEVIFHEDQEFKLFLNILALREILQILLFDSLSAGCVLEIKVQA